MKNILFIVTHVGAGMEYLVSILNENDRVQIYNDFLTFDHPVVLDQLTTKNHKMNNNSAVFGTVVIHNKDFCCKELYKFCKFIYLINEPTNYFKITLNDKKDNAEIISRHYCFRLRRIYEMAAHTPNAVVVDYRSLSEKKSLEPIDEYLLLRNNLYYNGDSKEFPEVKIPKEPLKHCQEAYERYLFKLKNLNIKMI
jgi:hypothetical protein